MAVCWQPGLNLYVTILTFGSAQLPSLGRPALQPRPTDPHLGSRHLRSADPLPSSSLTNPALDLIWNILHTFVRVTIAVLVTGRGRLISNASLFDGAAPFVLSSEAFLPHLAQPRESQQQETHVLKWLRYT